MPIGPIPEKNINFQVYLEGVVPMIGIAEATLPSLESMSETVSGSGLAGEIDSPTTGHFGPMSVTLNFRTITGDLFLLQTPNDKKIELRGATQTYDPILGIRRTEGIRVACTAIPKNLDLGTFNVGATGDVTMEFEVVRLKIWIDDIPRLELDKHAYKYVIDGVDHLLALRRVLAIGV